MHDLQKDTTNFFKINKTKDTIKVSEIGFKKPGRISVRVENFNPFYWNAKVTVFKRPVDEESGQIGMFIGGLTKGLGIPGFPGSRGDDEEMERLQALYSRIEKMGIRLKELKYDIRKSEALIKKETQITGDSIMVLARLNSLNLNETWQRGKELDDSIKKVSSKPLFSNLLYEVSKMYNEIMGTGFRFLYSIKGTTDINEIKLQVFPRYDSLAGENEQDTITKYFAVRDKANLKLRSSAGITFTYFRDKNTSYYVKPDLTIGTGKGDFFTPVISSFIHFYSNKNSGFKWGGAFGFGIPVTGERKDINFMLGPTVVLGRNEPVFISAGISGTSVARLGNGLQPGQSVPDAAYTLPLVYLFRPGAFISVTFNLKNISPGNSGEE